MAQLVKNPLASAGEERDLGPISPSRRSSGEGDDYPLQSSCLKNSLDLSKARALQAVVPKVAKSRT